MESLITPTAGQRPEFSIIIAVKNGVVTLGQCLDGIRAQKYKKFEVLVADGGSTDGTLELLEKYQDLIHWKDSSLDSGVYAAWNRALGHARGRWTIFLGADDYFWSDESLTLASQCAQRVPGSIGVIYGRIARVTPSGQFMQFEGNPWPETRENLKTEMAFAHQGVFHRTERFLETGLFDEKYKIAGDYDWFVRELKGREAVFFPELIVTAMRNGGISSRPETTPKYLKEVLKVRKAHGLSGFSSVLFLRFVRAYLRLGLTRVFGPRVTHQIGSIYRILVGKKPLSL